MSTVVGQGKDLFFQVVPLAGDAECWILSQEFEFVFGDFPLNKSYHITLHS